MAINPDYAAMNPEPNPRPASELKPLTITVRFTSDKWARQYENVAVDQREEDCNDSHR
jgi:hypothetical protein